MAKIRFNLNLNNTAIRSLNDLRENFHVDEILQLHEEGVLRRWLEVWGHSTELQQVNAIPEGDPESTVLELARIFSVSDTDSIRAWAVAAGIRQGRTGEQLGASTLVSEEIVIEGYHNGYNNLRQKIAKRRDDNAFVQAVVRGDFATKYCRMIMDYPEPFVRWAYREAPFALLAGLMEPPLREFVLPHVPIDFTPVEKTRSIIEPRNVTREVIASWLDEVSETGKIGDNPTVQVHQATYQWMTAIDPGVVVLVTHVTPSVVIGHATSNEAARSRLMHMGFSEQVIGVLEAPRGASWERKLFDGLSMRTDATLNSPRVFVAPLQQYPERRHKTSFADPIRQWLRFTSGFDQTDWTPVVGSDQRVMVVFASNGCKIRAANGLSGELGLEEINGHFPVLCGLECQATSPADEVCWIEVLPL